MAENRKTRIALLDVLRVMAILLVLNSHLDPLYPIPALATGGAAGNGLFFILSGYCLTLQPTFLRHMGRRALRLYPGAFIAFGVQLLLGMKTLSGPVDALRQFLWPTAFWFVGAIVLFDALLYWLDKLHFTRHFGVFTLMVAILYFAAYLLIVDKTVWSVEEAGLTTPQQCFKLIYCFYIYALGYTLRKRGVPSWAKSHAGLVFGISAGLFAFSFGFKLILSRFPATMPLQFLTQLAIIGFTGGAILCANALERWWTRISAPGLRRAFAAFAGVSLEMYLVQFPVISLCKALSFPINVLTVLVATVSLAFLLHWLDDLIFRHGASLIFPKKG
ncbi:MAG: acyltransferase family protein [Clostridia bacterium]|nr:acyltransferase family protein [Clostridia bacterium]